VEDLQEKKKKKKINPKYLTKDAGKMRDEIEKQADKDPDDPSAYKSHPKGDWQADYSPSGKRYKTKTSKWTSKFKKMYGENSDYEGEILASLEDFLLEDFEEDEDLLREFIEEVLSEKKKRSNSTKALKNKAEKTGAPMGALRTIYNKGLAAWRTGHRPGTSPHQWAMGRVNSVLAGGPARKVDAAQWKQIQKHRGKKRKKKK
jgi:hypothetical protein